MLLGVLKLSPLWSPIHASAFKLRATFNPLNAKLNPTCHLLALLEAHHIFHFSGLRVKISAETTLCFHVAWNCFVCFTQCHLERHEHCASVIWFESFHGLPQSLQINYRIVPQTMPQPILSTQFPTRTDSVFLTPIAVLCLSQLLTAP